MEAAIDDYRKRIHFLVDHIVSPERMKRVYSFISKAYQIQEEEKRTEEK